MRTLENEKGIFEEIKELHASGEIYRDIAANLTARGLTTIRGKALSTEDVSKFMRDNGYRCVKEFSKGTKKPIEKIELRVKPSSKVRTISEILNSNLPDKLKLQVISSLAKGEA